MCGSIRAVFNPAVLDDYLKMNFVISTEVDGSTDVVDVGVDLAAIKARQVGASRQSIAAAAPIEERRNITSWDFGDLERVVASSDLAFDVLAYPTLLDTGNSVALRVVTSASVQQRAVGAAASVDYFS